MVKTMRIASKDQILWFNNLSLIPEVSMFPLKILFLDVGSWTTDKINKQVYNVSEMIQLGMRLCIGLWQKPNALTLF